MTTTTQFRKFKLDRTGENVLHGTAMLSFVPAALGSEYDLHLGERVAWTDIEGFQVYALVYPSFFESEYVALEEAFCGVAIGRVEHKMAPQYSPDISAIGLELSDFPGHMTDADPE